MTEAWPEGARVLTTIAGEPGTVVGVSSNGQVIIWPDRWGRPPTTRGPRAPGEAFWPCYLVPLATDAANTGVAQP